MFKKRLKYSKIAILLLFFFLQYLGWQFLGNWDWFSNQFYPNFYKHFYPFWTAIFGWIPFSVGDILYLLLGGYLIYLVFNIVRGIFNKKIKIKPFVVRLLLIFNVFYFSFHALWGMNYYRNSLLEMTAKESKEIPISRLKFISVELLAQSKFYRSQCKEDDRGVFTYNAKEFYSENLAHSKLNFSFLPYQLIPFKAKKKKSLFSYFLRYAGVLGYYNPFTGEAQYTTKVPKATLPFTLAHEQGHQMGYAPEYEANFIGYLTGIKSKNKAEKYSANYKALRYVLGEVYKRDSTFVNNMVKNYSAGMERDRQENIRFQEKYSGKTEEIFSSLNNAYLKSNNQPEGLKSYNRFVELLVAYYDTIKKERKNN